MSGKCLDKRSFSDSFSTHQQTHEHMLTAKKCTCMAVRNRSLEQRIGAWAKRPKISLVLLALWMYPFFHSFQYFLVAVVVIVVVVVSVCTATKTSSGPLYLLSSHHPARPSNNTVLYFHSYIFLYYASMLIVISAQD